MSGYRYEKSLENPPPIWNVYPSRGAIRAGHVQAVWVDGRKVYRAWSWRAEPDGRVIRFGKTRDEAVDRLLDGMHEVGAADVVGVPR
jgi:hypothetical protein